MNDILKSINSLIYNYDCSLKVFNSRYDGESIYILLGYDNLIEGIETLLTGGDNDWDYCSQELMKHDILPITLIYLKSGGIVEGLKEIENKISNATTGISLETYLQKVSTILSEIIEY